MSSKHAWRSYFKVLKMSNALIWTLLRKWTIRSKRRIESESSLKTQKRMLGTPEEKRKRRISSMNRRIKMDNLHKSNLKCTQCQFKIVHKALIKACLRLSREVILVTKITLKNIRLKACSFKVQILRRLIKTIFQTLRPLSSADLHL